MGCAWLGFTHACAATRKDRARRHGHPRSAVRQRGCPRARGCLMRSSRLHWHRPTRRRTPSAGVVRRAGFGSRGNSHSSPAGRVIGTVSSNCAGSLSDSPRSSMPSSRCSSVHSDHKPPVVGIVCGGHARTVAQPAPNSTEPGNGLVGHAQCAGIRAPCPKH